MQVNGKHIVVIGAAKSGVAVARLLKDKGATVFVTDAGAIPAHRASFLDETGIQWESNGHSEHAEKADFAVVSPGVPTEASLVQLYLNSGRKVYSEIEAASWFCSGSITAITGSNGKTTTTSWLSDIWKRSGKSFVTGGNIGTAFSELIPSITDETHTVLEVSSFQLDHIDTFKPKISAILNITPDHLNRYNNQFERYAASKMNIMQNQNPGDFFVYNYDDPVIREQLTGAGIRPDGPQLIPFSMLDEVSKGAFLRNETIMLNLDGTDEPLMHVDELSLKGMHNVANGLAAAVMARLADITNDVIRESLSHFEGVEHRLELVRILDGVRYLNDSKATNINSVWYALQSMQSPVVLILGGRDKGNDYKELEKLIRSKVHTIIAIGESKEIVRTQTQAMVNSFLMAETMEDAVHQAKKCAKKGDAVLLSPACASFDMFDGYEHRGQVFKTLVNNL